MIIYPPYIADTIPAFITTEIKIPFVMNPAVGYDEIKKFRLKIKNYVDSTEIDEITVSKDYCDYDPITKSGVVTFNGAKQKWNEGQYYKFQLAFGDSDGFYSYSTASLGRCIGEVIPIIRVRDKSNQVLSETIINLNSTTFIGEYKTSILSEPLYSYRFYVQEQKTNRIVADSGVCLHNNDLDKISGNERTSKHNFILNYVLDNWVYYTITYEITTINGFVSSVTYPITKEGESNSYFVDGQVIVGQDQRAKDNGYVNITIQGTPIIGTFELQRTSDYKHWYTIATFNTTLYSDLEHFTWKDWSVEQGVTYIYAIREYGVSQNGGKVYSKRTESAPIQIEFEHMYLSDGNKQLKIAYNPKVNSIKDIILESKMDTIGSKYPFFFRNETVRYKELPLSGLLSYLMDDDELFLTNNEMDLVSDESETSVFGLQNFRTTNLTAYNFEAEKKFKLAVLDWLNNGEPKLFRSPAEGNYIVRLMNTSLSPNEQTSRMLHSFSSTAYEIADFTMENLQNYSLIDLPHLQDPINIASKTLIFKDLTYSNNECDILNYLKSLKSERPLKNSKISKIVWHQAASSTSNAQDYILIDGEKYYNGIIRDFETPEGFECVSLIVKKPSTNNMASTIYIEYEAEYPTQRARTTYRLTREAPSTIEACNEFDTMVKTSEDVLVTIPAGYDLYSEEHGVLLPNEIEDKRIRIYKTYSLTVRRDEEYDGVEDDFKFYFKDTEGNITNTINCSDGQIRYYNSIDEEVLYEKGLGLIVELYARIGGQKELSSSRLNDFILNTSVLGGSV